MIENNDGDLIPKQGTGSIDPPDLAIRPCAGTYVNPQNTSILESSIHSIQDKNPVEPVWKPLNLRDLRFESIVEKFSRLLGREYIADVRLSKDEIARNYLIDIQLQIYTLGIGERIVKYPDGWIEAVKERWLPARLKRRWSVKYKIFDAFAYWPTLHKYLPDSIKGAPVRAMFRENKGG